MTRVLLVEDERDIAIGIKNNLEIEGYEVLMAHSGEDGLALGLAQKPDLAILDLMLPHMSGFEVLEKLRGQYPELPVLILSARAEEVDKVRGFRGGADDYVTKPFGVMELMLRVRALLRRAAREPNTATPPVRHRMGAVEVDVGNRVVLRDNQEIALTPKAFDLLLALVAKRDRVVSRHDLLRDVWGHSADVTTRTVDAHIAELRRKIEADPANPQFLLTVWKAGYRLRA
jgi:two-component system, OmpR family, alkaline phosphatase synthesis response regulator PhoP